MKHQRLILAALAVSFGGCGEPKFDTVNQAVVGVCTRVPAELFGPAIECRDNVDCPCGSFCDDTVHTCTFSCLPSDITPPPGPLPGDPSLCAAGSVCDDLGHCVQPTEPPPVTVLLGANPLVVTTVAGGASKPFDVRLRLTDSSPAVVEAAESTIVRVVGKDGASVSCNGTPFADRCNLTSWSFVLAGQGLQATRQVRVQTAENTPPTRGHVILAIEATGARLVVPTAATPPLSNENGIYAGVATSAAYPQGIRLTAVARDHKLLVREPSRTIAPDGALLLDVDTGAAPTARRNTVWLRETGAPDAAGAIVGEYVAGKAAVDLQAGTLSLPVSFNVPGATGLDWTLALSRIADTAPECNDQTPCATGSVCHADLQACVPASVATPTTSPVENTLADTRSDAWWNKVFPLLQNPPEDSAFRTTGANLVESLLCSTEVAKRGRFSAKQIMRGDTPPSRSGDLDCIAQDGPNPDTVAKTLSPGAVGLATLADRTGSDEELKLQAVRALCMADLERTVPSSDFALHFGSTVARCASLSRFVPALRLLATDPLAKGTDAQLEPRARGLAVRLIQQWAGLQAFLATTGASEASYASVLDPTPASTTRTALTKALDMVDRGWGALLDKRIAPLIANTVRWSPSTDSETSLQPSRDYRLLKRPVVYWTFNNSVPPANPPPGTPPGPDVDIIRGVQLIPQASLPATVCRIGAPSFGQGFYCPGYAATLPSDAPSLVDDPSLGGANKIDNLTITLNVDARDAGGAGTGGPVTSALPAAETGGPITNICTPDTCNPPPGGGDDDPPPTTPPPPRPPPYRGGTLIATPTLAIAESVNPTTLASSLVLVHPTATGIESTTISGYGSLGTLPSSEDPFYREGTTVTVVRNAKQKRYTLYVWQPGATSLWKQEWNYVTEVASRLDWVPATTIRVGAPGTLAAGHYWTAYKKSYGGYLDDIAVFDSALSEDEVKKLSADRRGYEARRDAWPVDMNLARPAQDKVTQDVATPTGALLLEAQVAELELAERLLTAMADRAQVACDIDQTSQAATSARAEIDAAIARVGRILRRSHLVEGLAAGDTSERAASARELIKAKRTEIARAAEPTHCTEPFQMADDEVPLYHDTIADGMGETDAFFAASGFLQGLALSHANTALTRRVAAETAYVNARQSQIQQLEADNVRADRLLAIKNQYGDGLRRLCGLGHQTNEDFVHDNFEAPDPAHPFAVNTCYVQPTAVCLAQHGGPVANADANCYRGQLGENLVNLRAAYFSQQAAYQSWKAAFDNSAAAGRFCVLKEIDLFGCHLDDRKKMLGVTCPPGHQGTMELTEAYNHEIEDSQKLYAKLTGGLSWVGSILSGAASNPESGGLGALGGFLQGAAGYIRAGHEADMEARQRSHQLVLAKRAAQAEIDACWNQAHQYERAVQAAEMSSLQALSQFEAAGIGFANGIREATQLTIELNAALVREATRPSIPIAFHYWLGPAIAAYETELETARRYTYLALRATEYDMQDTYKTPAAGKPLRSAVLAATHPQQLLDQLTLLQAQTNQRMLNGRRPARNHVTFDVGEWQWGVPIGASLLGDTIDAHLRDVFDRNGALLGKGIRFSFLPMRDDEAPVLRCAERIWRVAVGAVAATGFPRDQPNYMISKLIKRNTFASRRCNGDGLQVAKWRSKVNLFVDTGEQAIPNLDDPLPAHIPLIHLDTELDAFRERDDAYNNSSRELSLLGLYGDYVLLFPKEALAHGLVPRELGNFSIRFDYLSIDDTPPIPMIAPSRSQGAPPVDIQVDGDRSPIIVD